MKPAMVYFCIMADWLPWLDIQEEKIVQEV